MNWKMLVLLLLSLICIGILTVCTQQTKDKFGWTHQDVLNEAESTVKWVYQDSAYPISFLNEVVHFRGYYSNYSQYEIHFDVDYYNVYGAKQRIGYSILLDCYPDRKSIVEHKWP